jgi:hypothetical protein
LIDSNNLLPVANFDNIYSGSMFIIASVSISELSSSFYSASALLEKNKTFIVKEVGAYVQFNNNLSETPFGYSASFYEKNILRDLNAVIYDSSNNTIIRTNKAANSYYDKNGETLIPDGQLTASLLAITYANALANQIIKNESVTGSVGIDRLYQTTFTQSFDNTYILTGSLYSSSAYLVSSLYNVIKNNVESPIYQPQGRIELVKNVEIPIGDSLSPVVAGKLVLEDSYSLIFSGSTDLKVILSILESANE